jgi:hypothetical protein
MYAHIKTAYWHHLNAAKTIDHDTLHNPFWHNLSRRAQVTLLKERDWHYSQAEHMRYFLPLHF